jgi:hypothetical protein
MPIALPDFKNTHCVSLTACGEIKTTDRALIKWLKKDKRAVADLNKSGAKTYVRVSLGDYTGKHFHVDVTKQNHFPKNAIPASSLTIDQIQTKFEHLIGKEVVVDLKGRFEIKISELSESGIIKSLLFQTQLGDVAIKLKGAKLSIKGAPVNEITWQTLTDGKTIGVIIETENLTTTVTESYLTSALAMLENALKVFVLGKITQ